MSLRNPFEDWEKMGRLVEADERIIERLFCNRVGPSGFRTFTLNVGKIGKGTTRSAIRSRLHYDKRDAEHADRADELESEGGRSNAKMEKVLITACEAQSRKDGVAALTLKLELPGEFSSAMRRDLMTAIENHFENQDHPVHWAVHSHNERGRYQPHGHMTVTKRPVRMTDGVWIGESGGNKHHGRGAKPILDGDIEVKAFRQFVAETVNRISDENGQVLFARWHPGSFRDIGVERPPLPRLPMEVYKGKLEPRPEGPILARQMIHDGRYADLRAMRRAWSKRDHLARMERRLVEAENSIAAEQVDRTAIIAGKGMVRASSAKVAATQGFDAPRTPTAKQFKLIMVMAHEAKIALPDGWMHRDAGEMIRDLREAKQNDVTRRTVQEKLDAPRTAARSMADWLSRPVVRDHLQWRQSDATVGESREWLSPAALGDAIDWKEVTTLREYVQDRIAWFDSNPLTENDHEQLRRSDQRLRQSIELASRGYRQPNAGDPGVADAQTDGRSVEAGPDSAEDRAHRGGLGARAAEPIGNNLGDEDLPAPKLISFDDHLLALQALKSERDRYQADAVKARRMVREEIERAVAARFGERNNDIASPRQPSPPISEARAMTVIEQMTRAAVANPKVAHQTLWTLRELYKALGVPEPQELVARYREASRSKGLSR